MVLQNKERAFDLYVKAAEAGSDEAIRNLAAMYATGEGVAKNEKTARYLLSMLEDDSDSEGLVTK